MTADEAAVKADAIFKSVGIVPTNQQVLIVAMQIVNIEFEGYERGASETLKIAIDSFTPKGSKPDA